jgi:hypothetical protein
MIIIDILIIIIIILYIVFLFSVVDPRHPCVLKTNRRRWGAPPPMSETFSRDGSTDTLSTLILQRAIGILRSRKLDFGTEINKLIADI